MTKFVNALLAGAFAAGLLVTPAAVAQTTDGATSTGGADHTKEKNQMDSVRENQVTPSDAAKTGAREGRKSMDDDTTGSTSNSTPKRGEPLGPTDTQD